MSFAFQFLLAVLCLVASLSQTANAQSATVLRDITYSTNGGVELKLDLHFPKRTGDKPTPVVLYVHGGGWQNGSKSSGTWIHLLPELVTNGYVVAAINYRLAPEHKWPAFIHDTKAAVRFLRANAAKYNIDPDRIAAWGTSAGGHIVALLGTTGGRAELEGEGGHPEESSRVQAVVNFFGPTELVRLFSEAQHHERASKAFGPGEKIHKAASPLNYVSKDAPPFLIIHGDKDALVPLEQSQLLHQKLTAVGASSKLIVVKNAAHGISKGNFEPTREQITKSVIHFLDEQLRAANGQGRETKE